MEILEAANLEVLKEAKSKQETIGHGIGDVPHYAMMNPNCKRGLTPTLLFLDPLPRIPLSWSGKIVRLGIFGFLV